MSDIVEDLQLGLYVEPEKVIAVIQALRQRVEELEVISISRLREQVINDFAQIDRGMEAELAASQQRVKDAELCTKEEKTAWENFDDDPSDYREGWADASAWLSNMILNQEDE